MAVLVSLDQITKSFSAKDLFENLSLALHDRDHIGLVGPNGAGKSTLAGIFLGTEEFDYGTRSLRKGAKLALVPQECDLNANTTVMDAIRQHLQRKNIPCHEAEIQQNLSRCGFHDLNRQVSLLSGGWKKRLSIIARIAENADGIILDEPTNHLDLEGTLWLERWLRGTSATWLAISHDRYFLNQAADQVWELNPGFAEGYLTTVGNFNAHRQHRLQVFHQQQAQQQTLKNKLRREKEWLSRQPKARTTKAQYRIDAAHAMMEQLESLAALDKSSESGRMGFQASQRRTKKLFDLGRGSVCWEDKTVFSQLDWQVCQGDRWGIIGPNGCGKTTLLKVLVGEVLLNEGKLVKADDLKIVYFDQMRNQLDETLTLRRTIAPDGDQVIFASRPLHVVSWAKRFRLSSTLLDLKISDLSGGERARALLAKLVLSPADLLILDEPTNDLDIDTLEVLEQSLREFPGALVLVTHDRFMLTHVCDKFLGFDKQSKLKSFASYDQWQSFWIDERVAVRKTPVTSKSPAAKKTAQKKLSYKEQREFDSMEDAIMQAETLLQTCQSATEDPSIQSHPVKLQDAYENMQKAQDKVDRLYKRWAELESKIP